MFYIFNWNIISLQCCVSFYCTVSWISYMYTYIPLPLEPPSHTTIPPLQVITEHWAFLCFLKRIWIFFLWKGLLVEFGKEHSLCIVCVLDVRAIWLWHLSPHWSPGLIWLIWLARRVSPFSLTAPCASLPKLCTWSKRMTVPYRGGLVFGQGCMSSCASLWEPSNKLSRKDSFAGWFFYFSFCLDQVRDCKISW